ncbi:MAG: hypothetical protein AAF352_00025 [Pseudomonadota bacterium]
MVQTREQSLQQIEKNIRRLALDADLCVCTQYDMGGSVDAPRYYEMAETPADIAALALPICAEGVSAIYIVRRRGKAENEFVSRKIVMHFENGRMITGKVGSFEGFWDEFVNYASNDPWVKRALMQDSPPEELAKSA